MSSFSVITHHCLTTTNRKVYKVLDFIIKWYLGLTTFWYIAVFGYMYVCEQITLRKYSKARN